MLKVLSLGAGAAALGYGYAGYQENQTGNPPSVSYKTALIVGVILVGIFLWMKYKR